MTVVICSVCGARVPLRSRFEEECPECGSDQLVEEDAYDGAPDTLRCVECGREVDGAAPGSDLADEASRYTVDDNCPLCERGELVPVDQAPPLRRVAEFAVARGAARRVRQRSSSNSLPVDV